MNFNGLQDVNRRFSTTPNIRHNNNSNKFDTSYEKVPDFWKNSGNFNKK